MKAKISVSKSGKITAKDSKGRELVFVPTSELSELVHARLRCWPCGVCALRKRGNSCGMMYENVCTMPEREADGLYLYPEQYKAITRRLRLANNAIARAKIKLDRAYAANAELLGVK